MHEIVGVAVDPTAPLSQSGLDSLGALELRASIEDRMSISLPATLLYDHPTAREIASFLQSSASQAPIALDAGLATIRNAREGKGHEQRGSLAGVLSVVARMPSAASNSLGVDSDCISVVPLARWDVERHGLSTSGTTSTRWAAFLSTHHLTDFDAPCFGLSIAEAVLMDTQQRLLLEISCELLSDSAQMSQGDCGVYVGIYPPEYSTLIKESQMELSAYHATGSTSSAAAGRISYAFGLKGPCVSIDTACSSSLIGLHIGMSQMAGGETTRAGAFGINIILNPAVLNILSSANMLSPRGRCAALDDSADG